jgi:HAD superfamily phosphatase (TIGR01668 family)
MLNSLTLVLRKLPLFSSLVTSRRQRSTRFPEVSGSLLPTQVNTLASLEVNHLINSGIRGIILDLDNTIVSEDDRYLSPDAEFWIQRTKQSGLKFFILSNGKRRYRVEYWSAYLEIPAIYAAKKPFPGSFRKALSTMELTPKQVVVIGDSRHTDMLGAWLTGCSSIQVASLPHPPRWWERLLGTYVQIPYPVDQELWEFHHSPHSKRP